MRKLAPFVTCSLLLLLASSTHASDSSPLGRGDGKFWLGMTRAQLDSAMVANADTVISNGTAFVVCRTSDPMVEYVQYSFFQPPHGTDFVWKVTVGYRMSASTADYAHAREMLIRLLGEPQADSWQAEDTSYPAAARPAEISQRVVWSDGLTSVSLGARWSDAPDQSANRMLTTWIDRRMQRLVQARGSKKEPSPK